MRGSGGFRPRFVLTCLVAAALALGGRTHPAEAQEEIPVTLRARTFRYDRATKMLVATGDVVVTYQDVVIHADRLEADLGTNDVHAEGHVRIEVSGHSVLAESLDYNLTTRRGRLTRTTAEYSGPFVLGTVVLRAEAVEGTLGKTTMARQAFCTTCAGPNPIVYLTAREFTVYPNDKIVGRSVTVWLGGRRIITWPYFVIYLREQRASRLFPVFGYSELEGYFVKTFYSYAVNQDHYGYLRLDLMEKLGTGYGIEHAYRFGAAAGTLFLYQLQNRQIGGTDRRAVINHQQQFGDVTARLYADTTTRSSPLAPSSDLFASLDTSWRTDRTSTTVYQTYANSSFLGFAAAAYAIRGIHIRQLSPTLSMELVADGSSTSTFLGTDDELIPRLTLRYRGRGYQATLLAEGRVDLDGSAFTGDTPFFTERLPEVTIAADPRLLRGTLLIYQLQAGLGRFRETLFTGTVESLRTDLTATVSGPLLETARGSLNLRSTLRGSHYTTGNIRAFVSGRIDYTHLLSPSLTGQLGHTYQDQTGQTPFTFDRTFGRLAQTDATLTYRRSNLLASVQASFDGASGIWQPVIARMQWAPREKWAIATAVQYDPVFGALSRAELAFDVAFNADWQVSYYGFYDGASGRIFHDRFTVTKLWADCLATAVTYRGPTQEVWVEAWLTALPWARGQVGIGSQGQLLFNQPWLIRRP